MKQLKFTAVKISNFSITGDFDQLCNQCGNIGASILPEVEFLNNKVVKNFGLSIFCSSPECRNLSYHFLKLAENMSGSDNYDNFTHLPKGIRISCNKCGSQDIRVNIKLDQSGFKFVYDLVAVNLSCSCGNCAKHQFLGKYF
ncbi:hypothetical protein [Desulfotomaculum defluvii]